MRVEVNIGGDDYIVILTSDYVTHTLLTQHLHLTLEAL